MCVRLSRVVYFRYLRFLLLLTFLAVHFLRLWTPVSNCLFGGFVFLGAAANRDLRPDALGRAHAPEVRHQLYTAVARARRHGWRFDDGRLALMAVLHCSRRCLLS